ncbi:MAG TPA: hypothetical protein VGV59_12915 [Pyrinomonadaceae bacterium]|nr:hypothetical protein [Pyrinomonadaceae bacterium]
MFDWQTIAVALIIIGAFVYVLRRGLKRLRSFRAAGAARASGATGCGSCGDSVEREQATKSAPLLVQISTRRTAPRERRR